MKKLVQPNFDIKFSGLPLDLLNELTAIALKIGIKRLALVGGAVRDYLLYQVLNEPWQGLTDLDLVIEGSAISLANEIKTSLGPKRVTKLIRHENYETAELEIDGVLIDLATARHEKYKKPGQNPVIKSSSLEEDLARRDFTVNSMALELPDIKLLDPFKGEKDLREKQLFLLHKKSIQDDPTRLIRGSRYSARLGLELSPEALVQIKTTLKEWPWEWKNGDIYKVAPPALSTRLRMELEILFKKEPWEIAIEKLKSWGGLVLLDQQLQEDNRLNRRLQWARKLKLPLLLALVSGAEEPIYLAQRLNCTKKYQIILEESINLRQSLYSNDNKVKWSTVSWCKYLEENYQQPEAIALCICLGVPMWQKLFNWWARWRWVKSPISAEDLLSQGWREGPELGAELERLRMEHIAKNSSS